MSLHIAAEKGQIAETVLMPGDPLRAKYIAENFLTAPVLFNEVRGMLGYTGLYKGVPVSVMGSGMGMPSMGIYSRELMADYGCRRVLRIGSAGSFHKDVKIGDLVLAQSASTDSNWQHTYDLPGNYAPCCSLDLLLSVVEKARRMEIPLHAGSVVSCDVFYEDDPDWWKKWAKMGVLAVEMEAAALYMNAARYGAESLAMMTISDQFVTGERMTTAQREKGLTDMIGLALEVAAE